MVNMMYIGNVYMISKYEVELQVCDINVLMIYLQYGLVFGGCYILFGYWGGFGGCYFV